MRLFQNKTAKVLGAVALIVVALATLGTLTGAVRLPWTAGASEVLAGETARSSLAVELVDGKPHTLFVPEDVRTRWVFARTMSTRLSSPGNRKARVRSSCPVRRRSTRLGSSGFGPLRPVPIVRGSRPDRPGGPRPEAKPQSAHVVSRIAFGRPRRQGRFVGRLLQRRRRQ